MDSHTFHGSIRIQWRKRRCSQSVASGDKAAAPENPTRTDSTFAGWYTDPALTNAYDFSTSVNDDLYLYAKWTATVKFEAGTEPSIEDQTVNCGQQATKPTDPTKDGSNFEGWFVKSATTYSAAELAALKNAIATDPSIADYYWIVDDEVRIAYDFDAPVDYGITLYARWDYGDCQVTYVDEGSELYIDVVKTGDKAENLEPDEIHGYTFNGWFADEALTQPYDFSTPVTEDLTLYAKWTQNRYTVTFNSNGGSEVASQSVAFEELARVPKDPVREGYTFMGWYYDLGEKISDEELAELEAAEAEYETEFTDLLWLRDDTTLVEYDLANEPVYDDLNLQARWYNGTFTCEVDIQDGAGGRRSGGKANARAQSITHANGTRR